MKSEGSIVHGETVPITVVVTSYCQAELTIEAVHSALNCNPSPDEVVVVDDASPDGAGEAVRDHFAASSAVSVMIMPRNNGPSSARNVGVRASRNLFVTTLDGDDIVASSDRFGKEFEILSSDPRKIACSVCVKKRMSDGFERRIYPPNYNMDRDEALRLVLTRSWIPRDPTFSRDLFDAVDGFDERMSLFEDWDFKIRLIAASEGVHCTSTEGTIYRLTDTGLSARTNGELARARTRVVRKNHATVQMAGMVVELNALLLKWRIVGSLRRNLKRFHYQR